MQPIRNILLAIDGQSQKQALVAEVSALSQDATTHVTLFGILDTSSDDKKADAKSTELHQWMNEDQLELMKDISSSLAEKGIQVSIKQSHGKPYLEIIREALRGKYDLIMKPAGSETSLKNILFGSTDMQLFRFCPFPVWAFKPTVNLQLRKIMIAVDLLSYDQEKDALADKVIQWGKYVANLVGAELHVIHIWDLYGEITLRGRSVLATTVDKLVEDEKQKHLQLLNEALARNDLDPNKVQIYFTKGEAKQLIPEIVKSAQPDLLVMGTVGRTGIPGFFIGNTADSVLRQVNCSVLAIKPDGFMTPVKLDA